MKWLTADGIVAALAVGAAVTWGLGPAGLAVLAAFFLSGSVLTQISGGAGGQRNARQVLANGGVAAVAAAFGSWYGAAGALAAAAADTWATEIGSYSSRSPRMITTMESVAPGTSGGVTTLGTLGGMAGGVLIGVLATALGRGGTRLALVTALAGMAGMFADSVAGATLQRRHLLDNDAVNVVATATGCGLSLLGSVL